MSEQLRQLAIRIAEELARRDVPGGPGGNGSHGGSVRGAPPTSHDSGAATVPRHHSVAARTGSSPFAATPAPGVRFVREQARIADFIDHTVLKAETTQAEIDKLCDEAREHRFAAVCVNPVWVRRCAERLKGSDVGVATVVGFPLGASAPEVKAHETTVAVQDGASEIDMVAAIGHIKCGDWTHVAHDIESVVRAAAGQVVKVIIESAVLTPVEIIKACALAKEMGANYVKTSTGFHPAGGASAEAIALMRMVVGDTLGVKASGGVRDCSTALRMIASGATRIGTSSGVAMAQCLGQGPLPVGELLSLVDNHAGPSCRCGVCEVEAGGTRAAAGPY